MRAYILTAALTTALAAICGCGAWDGAASAAQQTAIYNHALASGFSKGYLVSAGISLLAVVIALAMIRIKREDMEGIDPMAVPA